MRSWNMKREPRLQGLCRNFFHCVAERTKTALSPRISGLLSGNLTQVNVIREPYHLPGLIH